MHHASWGCAGIASSQLAATRYARVEGKCPAYEHQRILHFERQDGIRDGRDRGRQRLQVRGRVLIPHGCRFLYLRVLNGVQEVVAKS